MRRLPTFTALLPLVAVVSCGDGPLDPEWDALREAEERWEASGIDAYGYALEFNCLCRRGGAVSVVVEADSIVSAEWYDDFEGDVMPAMTVEEMFAEVRAALRRDPDEADVRFSDIGYPTDVGFDFDEDTLDDEWNFSVYQFLARD